MATGLSGLLQMFSEKGFDPDSFKLIFRLEHKAAARLLSRNLETSSRNPTNEAAVPPAVRLLLG